jgi:hypothetical protein
MKKRRVLTQEEVAAVFALEWEDKRAYVRNLLGPLQQDYRRVKS